MSKITNTQYKTEVAKYTKKDAIIALCFYAFYIAVMVALGFYRRFFLQTPLVSILSGVLVIGVYLAIVFIRKDGLASLGIRLKNLWPALRLGLLFGPLPLAIYSLILHLGFGFEFRPLGLILFAVLNFIMFAFGEDILFVGYIQTRIYGLIKKDWLAIGLVALLFALMHFPIVVVQHGAGAWAAIGGLSGGAIWLASLLISHCVYNAVFRRYAVLLPTVMLHTVTNVNFSGALWATAVPFEVMYLYYLAIVVAVVIWSLWLRRRATKEL